MQSIISSEIGLGVQIADFLHELVVLVIKLHVSPLGTNFLFVELFLGGLSDLLGIENNEGRPSSLSIEFLHENARLGDISVTFEEFHNVHGLDLVGQPSHDESSFLVVGSDILWKFDGLPIVESATRSNKKQKLDFDPII